MWYHSEILWSSWIQSMDHQFLVKIETFKMETIVMEWRSSWHQKIYICLVLIYRLSISPWKFLLTGWEKENPKNSQTQSLPGHRWSHSQTPDPYHNITLHGKISASNPIQESWVPNRFFIVCLFVFTVWNFLFIFKGVLKKNYE